MKRLFLLALCIAALCACAKRPTSTADVPRSISQRYQISVAPFTQPLHPGQMISGQLPEQQGLIPQDQLLALDTDLRDLLRAQTQRQFNFIPAPNLRQDPEFGRSSGQPDGLAKWLAYGKRHNAQLLLVPFVLDWHEREGSQAGVSSAAHVRLEFFLLNIPANGIEGRAVFEEEQTGLVDNLFSVADFVKRKGQWITARQLACEGMARAMRELGL